ncbi:hypothetical protein P4O66_005820, partial [Electrophorus voltai]
GFSFNIVWIQLCCAFRYGSEDLDVIGLTFRKDIWTHHIQLHPDCGYKPALTEMHETLLKKSGDQSYVFTFNIPTNMPCSVTLQPGLEDKGKPCGVDFEVKAYLARAAEDPDEKIDKKYQVSTCTSSVLYTHRDTCRLIIRKVQFAPDNTGSGQKAEICKTFMMSDKPVLLEAFLDKDIYYHGEPIPVKVKVKNETSKVVKKIRISIDQTTDVILYSADKYTKTVLSEEFSLQPGMDKEVLGILVSYKIKVNLLMSGGG